MLLEGSQRINPIWGEAYLLLIIDGENLANLWKIVSLRKMSLANDADSGQEAYNLFQTYLNSHTLPKIYS